MRHPALSVPCLALHALLLSALVPTLAHARQGCADPAEARQRLTFIQSNLHEDARRVRLWTGAWGAGYGLLTLGQLAATPLVAEGDQVDLYVGAVSSAGGLAALLAVPLDVMADSVALESLPGGRSGPVDCEVLAEAERLLVHSARSEESGRSWLIHGASFVYNVVTGLVLGLFFDRWTSALVTAATGVPIGEAMILTQPTGAQETLRRYQEGTGSGAPPPTPPLAWNLQVAVAPAHVGVQLRLTF